jgi:MOSC domain-containing protein YiiM
VSSPDRQPHVIAVAKSAKHEFSKHSCASIKIVQGLGVDGDCHSGVTVKHRSRVAADPTQPNLRQVHLMQAELFDELRTHGFEIVPSSLGENITTRGIDLLALPEGTVLKIGAEAKVQVTGLRNPCSQIENFKTGLLQHCVIKTDDKLIRKTGVMAIVLASGDVQPSDKIAIELPPLPHKALERV